MKEGALRIRLKPKDRILITGGTGMVGRALTKVLKQYGQENVYSFSSKDVDLRNSFATNKIIENIKPNFVFHLAARVHGIGGNKKYKSDILYENLMINTNVIEASRRNGVKKMVAMGSGCVYPELQNHKELYESQIWNGPPHQSEDSYAHAKRTMLAQLIAVKEQYGMSFAFAISGNLYGPHDNFDIYDGHVVPSLISKFYCSLKEDKPITVWGSGIAIRDFTYSEDAAEALYRILLNIEGPINLGSGFRHSISEIVNLLYRICGSKMNISWDSSKPDGQIERYYNLEKLFSTGFRPRIKLDNGLRLTYKWYSNNYYNVRKTLNQI